MIETLGMSTQKPIMERLVCGAMGTVELKKAMAPGMTPDKDDDELKPLSQLDLDQAQEASDKQVNAPKEPDTEPIPDSPQEHDERQEDTDQTPERAPEPEQPDLPKDDVEEKPKKEPEDSIVKNIEGSKEDNANLGIISLKDVDFDNLEECMTNYITGYDETIDISGDSALSIANKTYQYIGELTDIDAFSDDNIAEYVGQLKKHVDVESSYDDAIDAYNEKAKLPFIDYVNNNMNKSSINILLKSREEGMKIIDNDNESLVLLDGDGNVTLRVAGNDHSVGVEQEDYAMLYGMAVSIHNHPGVNTSFSPGDIGVSHGSRIRESHVYSKDYLHVMILNYFSEISTLTHMPLYEHYYQKAISKYKKLYLNKEISALKANEEITHEVMVQLSERLGFEYRRVPLDDILSEDNVTNDIQIISEEAGNNKIMEHNTTTGKKVFNFAPAYKDYSKLTPRIDEMVNNKKLDHERVIIYDDNINVIHSLDSMDNNHIVALNEDDRKYLSNGIMMHNHLSDTTFSLGDIEMLMKYDMKETILVTQGGDPHIYSMKPPKDGWNMTFDDFRNEYNKIVSKHMKGNDPKHIVELLHNAMKATSKKFGMRYTHKLGVV